MIGTELQAYTAAIEGCIREIGADANNAAEIERAADLLAETLLQGGLIYVAGVGGHANLCAGECLFRAGMLAPLYPMLDMTNLIEGVSRQAQQKKDLSYMQDCIDRYGIGERDAVIVMNAYSVSRQTVGFALGVRETGAKTVGIGSRSFAAHIGKPGHESGKRLYEVTDAYIDCKMAAEDTAITLTDGEKLAPTSTICLLFSLHLLLLQTALNLKARAGKIPVWSSINLPGGEENNRNLMETYRDRIRYLA